MSSESSSEESEQETNVLGRAIRGTRKDWGFTQIRFAELVGLSTSYLGAIERGDATPSAATKSHIEQTIELGRERAISRENDEHHQMQVSAIDWPCLAQEHDCTSLLQAASASDRKILFGDLLFLLRMQSQMSIPIATPELVIGLLQNREADEQ